MPDEKFSDHDSFRASCGGIAQLVERLVRNEKVRGSNPLTSSPESFRDCRALGRRGDRRGYYLPLHADIASYSSAWQGEAIAVAFLRSNR
jgi:hypothetical protein